MNNTCTSSISGLCINLNKTVALNVTLAPDLVTRLQSHFPFQWTSSHIDYLRIRLTPSYASLFASNYYPLLRSISSLMQSWQFPHLSWIGRINSMKMTILPKLLYYFRTLPVRVPSHFLRLLQNRIFQFIWANKHPGISRTTLLTQGVQGGPGIPNSAKYYLATQIAQLSLLRATFFFFYFPTVFIEQKKVHTCNARYTYIYIDTE